MDKVASVSYRISGDWTDPEVRFDKLFDGDGAQRQGAAVQQERKLTEVGGFRSDDAGGLVAP